MKKAQREWDVGTKVGGSNPGRYCVVESPDGKMFTLYFKSFRDGDDKPLAESNDLEEMKTKGYQFAGVEGK